MTCLFISLIMFIENYNKWMKFLKIEISIIVDLFSFSLQKLNSQVNRLLVKVPFNKIKINPLMPVISTNTLYLAICWNCNHNHDQIYLNLGCSSETISQMHLFSIWKVTQFYWVYWVQEKNHTYHNANYILNYCNFINLHYYYSHFFSWKA